MNRQEALRRTEAKFHHLGAAKQRRDTDDPADLGIVGCLACRKEENAAMA